MKKINISIWQEDIPIQELSEKQRQNIENRINQFHVDWMNQRVIEMIENGCTKDEILKYFKVK